MTVFRRSIHLLYASHETRKVRLRRWVEKWRQKHHHISMWHVAGKVFSSKTQALWSGVPSRNGKQTRMWSESWRSIYSLVEIASVKILWESYAIFWRRTHKSRTLLHAADNFHKGQLFDAIVSELRSCARVRKDRLHHTAKMDEHYHTTRKRQVIQALITLQIHRVGLRFRHLHQVDEMLFAFKVSTNRARYTKMLFR